MTSSKSILLAIAAAGGVGLCGTASAQTFTCPARFPMKTLQFAQTDDDWTAGPGDLAAPLESMGLFAGPPSEGAMLQPTTGDGQRESWTLAPPYKGGLWLQCAYGRHSLALSRPLPDIPKVCVAKYGKERPFQPRVIEFICR